MGAVCGSWGQSIVHDSRRCYVVYDRCQCASVEIDRSVGDMNKVIVAVLLCAGIALTACRREEERYYGPPMKLGGTPASIGGPQN
jgi:hypothetical protein